MQKITLHKYLPENRDEWQKFLAQTNNGTMFHSLDFLDYHPKGKFDFYHLMFRRGDELLGILPGGVKEDGKVFWSPVGASYGSIATKDIRFETALEMVDAMLDYFRTENFREIFLIPPPMIYSLNVSQHIEYAMLYRKFDFELHYISHAIDLKYGKDFLEHFDKTARKNIHKILREGKLSVRESDEYDEFYEILLNNKAKHNATPTHSLEDIHRLLELVPQNLKLLMVYYDGKPIAGSLLFLCNSKVTLCFYTMLLYEYEELKPVYLVNYEITRWATEHGYEWVDIGVSQDTHAEDPMTPSIDLINFKERFNSRGILRSTFHYKF
ncbi:MAG: GNAT family N-acetyltransferase [Candidatus Kapabacteria bacterium]|nr:GNAT family N-acetyltransferase [Candidatus Kapabacteria bacterium]